MLPAARILADNVTRLIDRLPERPPRPELAARMGIGDKTLGFIRAGTGNPTLESISNVADYLRVKTWQLLAPSSDLVAATELDPSEAELLELFRLTSPEMRAALLASARASLAASSDDASAALIRRVNPKHREQLKKLGLIREPGDAGGD